MSGNRWTNDKDLNKAIDTIVAQGWRVERGGKHLKAYPPDKTKPMITIPTTPSDYRSVKNIIANLRRGGAQL